MNTLRSFLLMKGLLFTTLLFSWFAGPPVASGGQIDKVLEDRLRSAAPMEKVPVILYMKNQVDLKLMEANLQGLVGINQWIPTELRYRTIVTALQTVADQTQPNVLAEINTYEAEGKASDVQHFWIRNIITLQSTPDRVRELAALPSVETAFFDGILELDRPVSVNSADANPNTSENGLRAINANKLWALGYTGQGRLVMNIDTGVNGPNVGLNSRWRGSQPGIRPGWAWFDPETGSTTPTDGDASTPQHGTHTMGIMCGLYTSTNETLGVAPSAQWIAARTINSSPHTSRSIAAFQWAANPDSNISTLSDVPDAISNSWFDPDVAATECSGASGYWTVIDAVEALGTAVVFSAGNNGPGPSSLTPPHNRNTTAVNIFAVGAVDANTAGYPIASFSSRGPSLCSAPDSLIIKPEVSAPGVNVRSTNGTNGYLTISGTSMAAPHVAGSIALLKSVAPWMTGTQLKYLLMRTASDLGTPGEDNNYGWGIIDLWRAYQNMALNFGWVKGTVTNVSGGAPLSGVAVDFTDAIQQQGSSSNASGLYLAGAQVDTTTTTRNVTLRARKFGFRDTLINLSITRNDTVTRSFAMAPVTGGTLVVRTVKRDSANIASFVSIRFAGNVVDTGSTSPTTGLLTRSLPAGSYDITIDPPNPYGSRQFNGVVINASGTTPVYAVVRLVVETTPSAMRDTLAVGQVHAKTLTMTNTTNDTIPYRLGDDNALAGLKARLSKAAVQAPAVAEKEVFLPKNFKDTRSGGDQLDGAGGPDAFGYRWIDSDEPGGPSFNWVDIKSVGTQVTTWTVGTGDDGYFTLPTFPGGFSFPFYGNTYTNLSISSNGNVQFGATPSTQYINDGIPSTAVPNNGVYPYWDDMDVSTAGGGTIWYYYDAANTRFIVQWDTVSHYLAGGEPGRYSYQVMLKPNGEVLCQYKTMIGTLNSATIGLENAAGTVALQTVFNAAYIHDNMAIRFYLPDAGWLSENPSLGRINPNTSQNITVTFDANGLLQGTTYNANIIMDLTHPDVSGSIPIPASLRVIPGVGPVISVNPTSLTFPSTIIGNNRRDSVRVRNVGSATLNITSVTTTNARYAATATSSAIAPGDSARVRVVYTPVIPAGSDTGRVIILSNDPANPRVDVILNGTSIGAPLFRARIDTLVRPAMQSGTRDSIRFYVRNAGTAPGNYAARAIMYPHTLAPGMSPEPIIIPMDVRVERMTPSSAGGASQRTSSATQAARGPVHQISNSQMADRSPFGSGQSFPAPLAPLAQFDLQFDYDASIVTGAAGNAAAVFINNEFWTSRWATGVLHRWTSSGTLIEEFTIAGVTGVRGLTTDGTFLYASSNTASIFKIDPVTKTLVGTITCAGAVTTRVIAYDPVRDGFWVSNFADALSCVNRSGAVIATIANTLAAKYGGAYDNYTPGGPYLWVFDQTNTAGGPPQNIWQFNLTTLTATGVAFDILTRVATGGATPIAGGLFVTTGLVPGKATIGGMLQGVPDRLFGLELADATGGSANWLSVAPTSGGPMAVNDSVLFSARFDASDPLIYNNPGNYFGRIEINAPGSPAPDTLKLPVRMFVVPSPGADLVVSPDSVDIGNVEIGSTDSSETVLVRNIGGSALTVTNVTFTGAPGFSSSRTAFTLASLDTLRIKVKFTAAAPGGVKTARMNFTCNDPSPQSVGLRAVSLGVAHIVASPDSFFFSRQVGTDTTTANLKIKNPGTDTLRYNINETTAAFDRVEPQPAVVYEPYDLAKGVNDPHPPYRSPLGAGGPDAFGYRWIDSDEPGGPAFSWVDISATGIALDSSSAWVITGTNRPGDEGYLPVLLPFPFSFYGVNKDSIFIGTNGNVMFQRPTGDIFTNAAFPTAGGAIDNHIGMFWDDLEVRAGAHVYYGTSGGNFVVQYQGIARYAGTVPNYTFEVILSPGGLIRMQYLAMGINAGIVNSASIGIENATGSIGLQTVFNAAYLHNNLAIIYTSDLLPWLTTNRSSGTVAPGDSQNVQLRVVGNQPPGNYFGHLRISGNTPDVANIGVRLTLTVDVQTEVSTIPTVFALSQNYPNPFNPTTRITYDLPEQATVTLKIYNVLGQEVATLANGLQAPGRYEALWDGRNGVGNQVSSGVYFYRFDATSASGISFYNLKKMLFLK